MFTIKPGRRTFDLQIKNELEPTVSVEYLYTIQEVKRLEFN